MSGEENNISLSDISALNINQKSDIFQLNMQETPMSCSKPQTTLNNQGFFNIQYQHIPFMPINRLPIYCSNQYQYQFNNYLNYTNYPIQTVNQQCYLPVNYYFSQPLPFIQENKGVKKDHYSKNEKRSLKENIKNKLIYDLNELYHKKPSSLFDYLASYDFSYKLSREIANLSKNELKLLFNVCLIYLHDLMRDENANLFVQELFKHLSNKQVKAVFNLIKDDFVELSCLFYSTYCVQTFISKLSSTEEQDLINLSSKDFLKMALNKQGSHVIFMMYRHFKDTSLIESFILKNLYLISKTKYGIGLIKKIITLASSNPKLKVQLANIVKENLSLFLNDEYAHYLILHMAEVWSKQEVEDLLESINDEQGKEKYKYLEIIRKNII